MLNLIWSKPISTGCAAFFQISSRTPDSVITPKQYAKDLLKTSKLLKTRNAKTIEAVAKKLATSYYSHAYPIKADVAANELKLNVIDATSNKQLWQAMWQLHKLYDAMIKESRDGKTMITTIFEAEEFTMPITKPLTQEV